MKSALASGTGLLFESDNLACAMPYSAFNMGSTFTVAMWVYFSTDLTTEQAVWCKEMRHSNNGISHRTCIKIKNGNIRLGVNSAGPASTGSYVEVDSGLPPMEGWNFLVVAFDVAAGVSRATTYLRRPDGTVLNGVPMTFTIKF